MGKITTIDLPTKDEICEAIDQVETWVKEPYRESDGTVSFTRQRGGYTRLTNDLLTGKYFLFGSIPAESALIEKIKAAGIPTTDYPDLETLRGGVTPEQRGYHGFDEFNVRRHGGE